MHPLEERLVGLLRRVYAKPLSIQSDTSRRDAELVAMAASMGLITTQLSPHLFGREWRITNKGLFLINEENT